MNTNNQQFFHSVMGLSLITSDKTWQKEMKASGPNHCIIFRATLHDWRWNRKPGKVTENNYPNYGKGQVLECHDITLY